MMGEYLQSKTLWNSLAKVTFDGAPRLVYAKEGFFNDLAKNVMDVRLL